MRQQATAQIVGQLKRGKAENPPKAQNKYHNVKTSVAGMTFDSKKESRRYECLMKAVELGIIEDLRLQHDFTLQEAYTTPDGKRIRAIRYKADFTYCICENAAQTITQCRNAYQWFDLQDLDFWSIQSGKKDRIVEDVKSKPTRTKTYIMKKKMMADRGYDIREV